MHKGISCCFNYRLLIPSNCQSLLLLWTQSLHLLNDSPCSQITNESADDQRLLSLHYPGREEDLVYGYVKEGTKGAEGMPLNVQVSQMDFAQKKE